MLLTLHDGRPAGGFAMRKLICLLGVVVVAAAITTAYGAAKPKPVVVSMMDGKGQSVGMVTISQGNGGLNFKLDLKNLTPGLHGFHVHQNAKCEGPAFTTAGPHFNPDTKQHGTENPMGPHAGDMMNITVGANGTVKTTVMVKSVTMGTDSHSIFTNGGTALVIHAKADDYKTDPSGNSGDRIACGTITKTVI
jgi:Cu-Zn family superoxide dismutase